MNTVIFPLLVVLTIGATAFNPPIIQSSPKHRATKLAHYEMSAYVSAHGTKLRVHVNKELGGQVAVQLMDLSGTLYVNHNLGPTDTTARLSLDLTQLADGDYFLKVSNGLEMETREIRISTRQPVLMPRSVKVL
jgi:hypothetical protein